MMGRKVVIPSLKWREDKYGSYRYMRTQTTKYICMSKSTTSRRTIFAAEVENSQRFGDDFCSGSSVGLVDSSEGLPDSLKGRVLED